MLVKITPSILSVSCMVTFTGVYGNKKVSRYVGIYNKVLKYINY